MESGLTSVKLSPLLKTIEEDTFYQCKDLKTVEFPEGLEKIGLEAFMESGIEHAEFPGSLKIIA